MFSTRKYNSFKYLLLSISISLISISASNAYGATTLTIVKTDNSIGTAPQSYTSSAVVQTTVLQNNSVQLTASSATPEIWSAEFSAPLNKQLVITNYEDASLPVGFPNSTLSPTKPGLNISIGGRQCATISGRFDVLEVSYDEQGMLLSLAVDFVQKCSINKTVLTGSIRHNTPSLPLITTNPIANAGADQHVIEANIVDLNLIPIVFDGNQVKLNAANSSAGDGASITSYLWKQISGTTMTLSDSSSATPSFELLNIPLGGDKIIFELTIINTNGAADTDEIIIFAASKSDPQSSFFFESDPTDEIGRGTSFYADIDDAVFNVENTDNYHAHITINSGNNWITQFGAITGSTGLTVGQYDAAKLHPVTLATDPGLYIHDILSAVSCKNVNGDFTIKQINRDASDIIKNLYIGFLQECNQINVPNPSALRGVIKINYIDTSVPAADAGIAQSVTEASLVMLNASNSNDADGSIDFYKWQQISGTPVTLSDDKISRPTFIAPDFAISSNEDLIFEVIITDNLNFKAKSSVNISIIEKVVKPPIVVQPQGKDGSAVGGGGGGCSINNNATFDATFYLLFLLSLLIQLYRRQSN
jgi:hypothetical protein